MYFFKRRESKENKYMAMISRQHTYEKDEHSMVKYDR